MQSYYSHGTGVTEEMMMEAYVRTIYDHLSVVYDKKYNSSEAKYKRCMYLFSSYGDKYTPSSLKVGPDLLEELEKYLPEWGKRKNSGNIGYFCLCAYNISRNGTRFIIPHYTIPAGGTPVTLSNMGSVASERFPLFHGVQKIDNLTKYETNQEEYEITPGLDRSGFLQPAELSGSPAATVVPPNIYRMIDLCMDRCCGVIHQVGGAADGVSGMESDDPAFYKRTKIYSTFRFEDRVDGRVDGTQNGIYKEGDSTKKFSPTMAGQFGWYEERYTPAGSSTAQVNHYERKLQYEITVHSELPFPYKAILLLKTSGTKSAYQHCKYEFAEPIYNSSGSVSKSFYSVVYESPQWITGNHSFAVSMDAGSYPGETWYMNISDPRVIIIPEFPDRLQEMIKG